VIKSQWERETETERDCETLTFVRITVNHCCAVWWWLK